jgi:hypothetical protein
MKLMRNNYRSAMKDMMRHREDYHPAITFLMDHYNSRRNEPLPLRESGHVFIILELIDLGYLDREAFVIDKSFGQINSVIFRGVYPLLENGEVYFRSHKKRFPFSVFSIFLFIAALIFIIMFFYSN